MIGVHLGLAFVSLLFGVSYVFGKILLFSMEPGAWIALRVTLTSAFFWILFGKTVWKKRGDLKLRFWHLGVCALFGVVINQISFIEGLQRTIPSHSAIMNTSIPIWTLIFSVILKREQMNLFKALGVLLSFIGVLYLLEVDKLEFSNQYLTGDLLCLLNACSFSFYLAYSKGPLKNVSPILSTTMMFSIALPAVWIYGVHGYVQTDWQSFGWQVYANIAFLVLGPSVLTYLLNNWALQKVDSSTVAIYIYIQPLVSMILSYYLLGEQPTARMLASSVLVVSGVMVGTGLIAKFYRSFRTRWS
ncbi:MAG: hypothetical protein COT74_10275 [Bdellovibrionales bacterium CG10_big_fil_rev_8_21_14_0_10_45_34]|nr:MAG: hypothetical protein COT74_10275 [Bdellovibrionales bacterium CG10_big_fil_rev_8_21_14_0_10_45_34]